MQSTYEIIILYIIVYTTLHKIGHRIMNEIYFKNEDEKFRNLCLNMGFLKMT